MGLMDKLKETAGAVKDRASTFAEEQKLTDKLSSAKDSVKKSWDESTAAMKESSRENKELKQALEGAIIRYEVIYIGGLPEYTKTKHGNAIGMNVMQDRFSFRKTGSSKEWFQDFDIMYDSISDIHIEKRTISTAEMFLGGGNDANQQQENNICITFDRGEMELMLRVEMLTGTTIYAQAGKCREFLDILRQNGILKQIQKKSNEGNSNSDNGIDVLKQIEKLASLKEGGIITEEEFNQKRHLFWKEFESLIRY